MNYIIPAVLKAFAEKLPFDSPQPSDRRVNNQLLVARQSLLGSFLIKRTFRHGEQPDYL